MVRPNELRIGNNVTLGKEIVEVQAWMFIQECKNMTPILITPEILEKCGFKKHSNSNEFWNHWVAPNGWNISEALHSEESAVVKKGLCYWGETYLEVQYLHQLQNLFFCHCKTELTYTP